MYGLVLEGGGAKGAYHIGAYRALMEEGIRISGIAGTSVGALNGAFLAQGDYDRAHKLWSNLSYSKVMEVDEDKIQKWRNLEIDKDDIASLTEKIKEVFRDKGLDITPLKNMISDLVEEEKIRESGLDFGIVTVSLTDLKPLEIYIEDIPQGELGKYLLASAYFPAFKIEELGGKKYLDGAFYNNLPINLLTDKGYKDLIIVRTHGAGIIRKPDLEGLNTIVISPKEDLGGTLDFNMHMARYNLELGYYDGLRALRGLKGESYYIEPLMDEDYFIKKLFDLEEEEISKLAKIFKIEGNYYRRGLFEEIIPKTSRMLGEERSDSYENLFLLLVERLAKLYNIEKFKVYNYKKLLSLVKVNLSKEKDKDIEMGALDKLIERVDLFSLWGRDELIKEIGKILL